jgi:hypothetical protein
MHYKNEKFNFFAPINCGKGKEKLEPRSPLDR